MDEENGDNYYSNWTAYPGYNNGTSFFNLSSGWDTIYYSSNWKGSHQNQDDWCVVELTSDDIGLRAGYYGVTMHGNNYDMNGVSVASQ